MSGPETVAVEKAALQTLIDAGWAVFKSAPRQSRVNADDLLALRRAIWLAEQACGDLTTPPENVQ